MAAEHGMIEPFSPEQVRVAHGHKIISYGTSSYGYDVRCADEFKIFTNINSTIVDPKNFDEKSFVDFKGPVCIIPPNSFALASTVEYFRIPRSVLIVTVGKSTYARCFRGDTRVALVDGTAPTLEEMATRHDAGELFWGYSIGQNGRLIVSLLHAPRFIGRDSLLEVEVDNGERIHATPDHLFMRRDGRMAKAHDLRPRDALMPLYRDLIRGYESVYQPIDGHLYATHRLADEWNLRHLPKCDRSVFRRFPEVNAKLRGTPAYRNHKVAAVRELRGDHDVYCLTVPEAGNFALEAGVFVHNCGIIVNVTPLEPEWEGHVTLEFSNTTPLPAKIYANEGVAQMLFFESDEVCETSYRDRGGKYQGQRGVTLPKT
jgi:deoxycytidine triphosphate deaminase